MAEVDGVAVTAAVAQLLSAPVEHEPVRLALGYANEHWRVVAAGRPLLLKIAPRHADLGKAEAASRALWSNMSGLRPRLPRS
jgi:hypothetical protein